MIFRILRKQLSCRQVAVIIGRLIIIEFLLLGFGILAVSKHYYTYEYHSFSQSPSVAHNNFFPSLPLALSYAITNNQTDQINQILSNDYGSWKLVMTDEEGEKVINYSQKNLNREREWISNISHQSLRNYPYNLLLNPSSEKAWNYYFNNSKTINDVENLKDENLLLGRVYYINIISESFQQELWQWLNNPLQNNSRFPVYNLTILLFIIGGLFIWSFTEFFLTYRILTHREKEQLSRRLELEQELVKQEIEKRKIADQNQDILRNKQSKLQKEIAILQNNLKEKINQNSRLIEEREKEQQKLEELENKQTQKIKNLQKIIKEYEQEILILEVWQERSQELETIKQEKNNLLVELSEYENLERKSKEQINSLREKIKLLMAQKQEAEEKIDDLQTVQLSNETSIQEREEMIQKEFERQINLIKLESEYAFEEAQTIEKEKEKILLQNKEIKEKLNSEIEKNKCLEFALDTYKKGKDYISNATDTNNSSNYPSIPTSYLTNISSRKAIKAFQKLGFEKDRHNGDHFILKKIETHTITVPIPHPRQELNPLTLKNILIQTNTSLEDFLDNL
ncbi:type II toxin-antitoxin system HicA family toxin [Crocosphaera chwakensis]|uniref:type II toxin-antitoxin system HicA family toxin n=1 Tax=Crocosphaera chwakensis TaxID=2546361 RepID=UPI000566DFEC|nr:type II toxin-antitoxin system HicA family toxin [Crocosphaera chwakensis]